MAESETSWDFTIRNFPSFYRKDKTKEKINGAKEKNFQLQFPCLNFHRSFVFSLLAILKLTISTLFLDVSGRRATERVERGGSGWL